MNLIDCFQEDFVEWLSKSNNPKIQPYIRHQSKLKNARNRIAKIRYMSGIHCRIHER